MQVLAFVFVVILLDFFPITRKTTRIHSITALSADECNTTTPASISATTTTLFHYFHAVLASLLSLFVFLAAAADHVTDASAPSRQASC